MATNRRSGLGRGLGALIPSAPESETASEQDKRSETRINQSPLREVPVDSIRPNTYQPRKNLDQAQLEPLAASIKEVGVLQPLLVRADGPDSYELIAGERRWRASQQAGLKVVPVILREAQDVASLEQALVENLHRKDLNPLDEASAYRQLIDDFSMTHDQVGKRVGKSRAAITNLMRLLQLPGTIQRLILEGHLSEGHARALLPVEDQALAVSFAERAARDSLSVRAVEELVKARPLGRSSSGPSSSNERGESASPSKGRPIVDIGSGSQAAALEWQDRLGEILDTRVGVSTGKGRGKITIEFADVDDLDRIGTLIQGKSPAQPSI